MIKSRLLQCGGYGVIPLSVLISFVRVIVDYRILRKAQVVVVMSGGGFGHTVMGPDVTRRLFQGRRKVFICLSYHPYHNPKAAIVWPDIDVIFLPFSFAFNLLGRRMFLHCPPWFVALGRATLQQVVRLITDSDSLVLSLLELYDLIPVPENLIGLMRDVPKNFKVPLYYFKLRERIIAPPIRLPEAQREKVKRNLYRNDRSDGHLRVCCLYLRQKGAGLEDVTTSSRTGSPLEEFLPAIRLLNKAGYKVFVVGDVDLDKEVYTEFKGMLADARSSNVDKRIFDLFAATEADVFVGEPGGGSFVPGINAIPCLLINAFPYFFAMPNSWICYKKLWDPKGQLVHYSRLFDEYAYDYSPSGMRIEPNNAEEIYQAVSEFIDDLNIGQEISDGTVERTLPDHVWAKHLNARISGAWIRLFGTEIDQQLSSPR